MPSKECGEVRTSPAKHWISHTSALATQPGPRASPIAAVPVGQQITAVSLTYLSCFNNEANLKNFKISIISVACTTSNNYIAVGCSRSRMKINISL